MTEAALEQQDETITAGVELVLDESGQIPETNEAAGELEEFDVVLTGQEEAPKAQPDSKDFILKRMSKKKDRLQSENDELKRQLTHANQPTSAATIVAPDEYNYEDRREYLQAKTQYDRQMIASVASEQRTTEQNQHRIKAYQQEEDSQLQAYADSAAKLKVSDFNLTQDKAMDVLGEDLSRVMATQLPEDAPKLMYWFGKNPRDAEKYRDMYANNPGAMTFNLGKLAGNLTVTKRDTKAAQPERKTEASGAGGINDDYQMRYDKIMDATDDKNIGPTLKKIRELKAEAKAAGVTL